MNTDFVELDWGVVHGALLCAADQDIRYYLNGVYFDWPAGRIAATDGHILYVAEIPVMKWPAVIVPRQVLDICRRGNPEKVKFSQAGITTDRLDCTLAYAPIDGKFPGYAKVVPKATSGKLCQFNAELLARCQRALGGDSSYRVTWLAHNGPDGGAVMTQAMFPRRFCIIMPIRTNKPEADWGWFFDKPVEEPEAKPST